MEKALGIPVVRHITKKPAGDAVDLEKHFRSVHANMRTVFTHTHTQHLQAMRGSLPGHNVVLDRLNHLQYLTVSKDD